MKTVKKIIKSRFILLVCAIVLLPVAWIMVIKLEGKKPSILIEPPPEYIGKAQTLSVTVSDPQTGVRKVWIGLVKDGKETVLFQKHLPSSGIIGGGEKLEASFNIKIEPESLGITDGKAILRMVAKDFSWRSWLKGNTTYLEKDVVIDTKPPDLGILTRIHNVSQGGTGLVIYKLSEPCLNSGVTVGENFFPGYSGYFKDKNIFMAFFTLNYTQGPGTNIFVKATDFAGNNSKAGFPYYIKKRTFKNVVIKISDKFLNWKMPEFNIDVSLDSETPMIDKFLKVNRELRISDGRQIVEIVSETDKKLYWNGAFLRLPNSARKANFADHREYKYKDHIIDQQVHLGIDLASVAHSPVPSSNNGKVVFAGDLGIYGKTIVLDHGFGLFSIYSHLSAFDVKQGQMVSKGEVLGRTGSTGLAGGDHLHFGIIVHNTFVNPVEWWDANWIKNNISTKIETIKSLY
ncbi:MAG: M23 family metallopeptidase [Deltaproteobacteria bacterium]|nr:M23 family metallopeptidase [Deltaproteobacteria bacterium]